MDKVVKRLATIACLWTATASAEPNAETVSSMSAARHAPPAAALHEARLTRYAAQGGEIDSLLVREDLASGEQRLTGLTHFRDGTRLWEEARLDRAGKLIRAETMCSTAAGPSETVVYDAQAGSIELRMANGTRRWNAPTDHPWIWAARGCGSELQKRALATPVLALVALRATTPSGVRRVIDAQTFMSHAITGDQVIVPENASSVWVVLGDDAVLVRDGSPERWRVNALKVDVVPR